MAWTRITFTQLKSLTIPEIMNKLPLMISYRGQVVAHMTPWRSNAWKKAKRKAYFEQYSPIHAACSMCKRRGGYLTRVILKYWDGYEDHGPKDKGILLCRNCLIKIDKKIGVEWEQYRPSSKEKYKKNFEALERYLEAEKEEGKLMEISHEE